MKSKSFFSRNLIICLSFVFLFVCKLHANNCVQLSSACCQIGQLNLAGMCAQLILPGDTTIDEGGLYKLPQNTQGCITVDADNVRIDLCGATLHCPDGPAITILPGHTNIEIKNGKIKGTPDLANDGILTYSSSQLINIKDMKIYSCDSAIHFVGAEGHEVKASKIKNSEFYDCNKGIFFEYTKKCVCENCEAFNCIFVGFDQTYSKFNHFDNCKAFETSNGELDERAIGFSSFAGKGNLFTECIAEGTSKTADCLYCRGAIGFLLTGTEGKMETETKIVQCIANSTSVLSTGSGIAFGIKLEPVYTGTEFKDDADFGAIVFSVDWSPDGRYLAAGGSDPNDEIKVYSFYGDDLSLTVTGVDFGGIANSVRWSPDGKYLAAGGTDNASEIRVFSFDGAQLKQVASYADFTDDVNSVDWSPDGKYLAAGVNNGPIGIFRFDATIPDLLRTGTADFGSDVNSVDWSPDGKYLAAGGEDTGAQIKVYSFNGANLVQVGDSVDFKDWVHTLDWSPDGKYLAVGGDEAGAQIKIYTFDGMSLSDPAISSVGFVANVRSVDWSPDGKYLAAGGTLINNQIKIYSFNGTNLSQEEDVNFGSFVFSVDWSPCGRFIAGGGEDDGAEVKAYCVMDAPSRCLIDSNKVCNATGGDGRHGIGISGSGDNFYISNVAYENDVNFNEAIHPRLGNTFGPKFICTPENYDNLFNG
ncbi:right-handed parallel beta-helix repeat-containing protein [Candidatus Dependentiae bacterium]